MLQRRASEQRCHLKHMRTHPAVALHSGHHLQVLTGLILKIGPEICLSTLKACARN